MTKYKSFYNAWQGFAKPKRQLLLERTIIPAHITPDDFLALTTDEEEMDILINHPSIKEPFDAEKAGTVTLAVRLANDGTAKVIDHEGRNRSYAAKKAGIKSIPLNIIVVDKDGASYDDIAQFKAQFTPTIVQKTDMSARAVQDISLDDKKVDDPLKIGESRDFKSYIITDKYGIHHSGGIIFFLEKKYNNDNALHNLGFNNFIELINKTYSITDSSGRVYNFVKNRMYQYDNKKSGGLYYMNFEPHPVEVYGTLEAANEQTYTLKKKTNV